MDIQADIQTDSQERVRKIRAVVIKETLSKEADKRLTLIAKGIGKTNVFARGAKNAKSKLLCGTQPFCYCDFVLFCGNGFFSVTQAELIRNFSVNYDELHKIVYGTYFLELADKFVMHDQEADDIMLLLINALHVLEKTKNGKLVSSIFQMKLMQLSGMFPDIYACAACGTKNSKLSFSIFDFSRNGGFLCDGCKSPGAQTLVKETVSALDFIRRSENTKRLFAFEIPDAALNQLNTAAESIISDYLETNFKCLEIIKET